MNKRRRRYAMLYVTLITIAFVICLSVSSCRTRTVYIPQNELGDVDFYGFIINGYIPDVVMERIKDKEVAVVSKGLIYEYWRLKHDRPE